MQDHANLMTFIDFKYRALHFVVTMKVLVLNKCNKIIFKNPLNVSRVPRLLVHRVGQHYWMIVISASINLSAVVI